MSITRTADLIYAFRFLRLLTKKWTDMPAYELGIIDDEGKVLKKSSQLRSNEEKAAYTIFHRLVFNIRRILQKLPFGKTQLASYAAALFLLKENTELSEEDIESVMKNMFGDDLNIDLTESKSETLTPGVYKLISEEIIIPTTCESIYGKGSEVTVEVGSEPVGNILGEDIYKVYHKNSNQFIFVSSKELTK